MKRKHQILSSFMIVLSLLCSAQDDKVTREDFLFGEFYLDEQQYTKALSFYLSVSEKTPENFNVQYRIGECLLNILGRQDEALKYLKQAVDSINPNYLPGRFKDVASPPRAWLLLGDSYLRANLLTEASYAYHQYQSFLLPSEKQELEDVKRRLRGLGISFENQRSSKEVNEINLGHPINTRFSEYNAVLSGDQKTIVYTSYWETFDKVFMSVLSPEGWSVPRDITEEIGSSGDCYTTALSFEGDELYLVRQGNYNSDIFISRYVDEKWTKMEALSKKINSKYLESSASISSDGKLLYVSSDKPGGKGGFDIYVSERSGNGWGRLRNLGDQINTGKNEEAPYISICDQYLFFSSNGHESLGGLDFVFSTITAEDEWGKPVNLGAPYNTTEDDIFILFYPRDERAYLSRDIQGGFGKNDIYIYQVGEYLIEWPQKGIVQSISNSGNFKMRTADKNELKSKEKSGLVAGMPEVMGFHVQEEGQAIKELPEIDFNQTQSDEKHQALNQSQKMKSVGANMDELKFEKEIIEYFAIDSIAEVQMLPDSIPVYTIQIIALLNPKEKTYFKNVDNITVSKGDDGFYRYTFGEYKGYSKAIARLDSIRNLGFYDAFIRETIEIQNYGK